MKRFKLIETGFSNSPLVAVFFEDEEKKRYITMECSAFTGASYLRMTKKQCERLGKFLIEFARKGKRGKKWKQGYI